MDLSKFVDRAREVLPAEWLSLEAWDLTDRLSDFIRGLIPRLPAGYRVCDDVAIHEAAVVERAAIIKGPAVVCSGCFVSAGSCLRQGVFLDVDVTIGASCEIKNAIVFQGSRIAHLNFIGDSVIGRDVNMEAGAVLANHWNEREDKRINVVIGGKLRETGKVKFGALVGDRCRIGANAVTSPGTILEPGTTVHRLQLVDQVARLLAEKGNDT